MENNNGLEGFIISHFLKQSPTYIHFLTFALLHFCKLDFNVFESAKENLVLFLLLYIIYNI